MPRLTPHNSKVVDQHNRQAPEYARLTASLPTDRGAQFRSLVAPSPEDRVLDVACGPGLLATSLAPYVAEVIGLDLTPGMLVEARKRQAQAGVRNILWMEGDAAGLPFPDASFSLVVCSAAFHHFEGPVAVLKEMKRVCGPGGRIAVTDVTPPADKSAAYDRIEFMRDPSHRHAHSIAEFVALGRAAGLPEPVVQSGSTGAIPFDGVLATSHPEQHSKEDIKALLEADALSGTDSLGFRPISARGG